MKSKSVVFLSCFFSLFFLFYLFRLADNISNTEKKLIESPNVLDVTEIITTKLRINNGDWKEVKIPAHRIVAEKDFREGNFAYYQILVPAEIFKKLPKLPNEIFLGLQYVSFSRFEVSVNGKLYRANTPVNHNELILNIPLEDNIDNLIDIKGWIKAGDTGINHRGKIIAGKGAELNELHRKAYKGMTVFQLIFILSKGSILFVFVLVYLVTTVSVSFEKFLLFGFCVVAEEFLAGDYVSQFLNFNQVLYLFTVVNIGAVIFLFLFLSDVRGWSWTRKQILLGSLILSTFGFLMASDVLFANIVFNVTHVLRFWNMALASVLIVFIPQFYRRDKILSSVMLISLSLTLWSTFFSANVGFNYKAFGSLLLFYLIAYQTFLLLRKEQDLLRVRERELIEQEKDVAIGRTASLLAHDVRRPLEQMRMVLERVASGAANSEFIETARRDVEFSLTSVNNQVNDIVNYSKNRPVTLTAVSFYDILAGAIQQVMTINQNLQLNLRYEFKASCMILGDESRMSGALTNLLTNAVEAIRDIGKKQVGTIAFSTYLDDKNFVFEMRNDGPPIPENLIGEIFKPLFTFGKEKGTGLGLASVARTAQEHGGSVRAENTQEGVRFILTLQCCDTVDVVKEEGFKPSSLDYGYMNKTSEKAGEQKLRILILDDDTQVFDYFSFLSTSSPYPLELVYVTNVEEALKAINQKRFDLYLLDYDLGSDSKTGLDFYREHLSFLGPEVVIHSNREVAEVTDLKCTYVRKPLSSERFYELLQQSDRDRLRVMLVDDSELVLEAWTLFHGRHNLITCRSPEEALKLIAQGHRPDMAVLDYYFDNSGMNGSQLGRELKTILTKTTVLISSAVKHNDVQFPIIGKNDFDVRKYR
ncbi:MAG: ATP-binding protein [Bdellovibrionota bacterium]